MSRKLNIRKTTALAVSLMLAGAAIFGSAASAKGLGPRNPVCDAQVANACVTNWQTWGYAQYQDCVGNEQCLQCPPNYGYLCGYDPRFYYNGAIRPDQPW